MRWKCPHCGQAGIAFRVKLLTPFEHDLRCSNCTLKSRQAYCVMQSFVDQFAWFAMILGAVYLIFTQAAWLGLLAAFLAFMVWAGLGHLLAPLRASHQPYSVGFGLAGYVARIRGLGRGK